MYVRRIYNAQKMSVKLAEAEARAVSAGTWRKLKRSSKAKVFCSEMTFETSFQIPDLWSIRTESATIYSLDVACKLKVWPIGGCRVSGQNGRVDMYQVDVIYDCGSVVSVAQWSSGYWLAHLPWNSSSGTRFRIPWEALGKLFTHTASPVSQLQETWVQKGVFVT